MFKFFRLGVLFFLSMHVMSVHATRVNMCNITEDKFNTYVSGKYIATARYFDTNSPIGCDYEIKTVTGTSSSYCVLDVPGHSEWKLPVPEGMYLASYYHANNTCGSASYDNVGTVKAYKGTTENICLVPKTFQSVPGSSVLSTKGNINGVCPEASGFEIATVKVSNDGVVWCKPNPLTDTRVSSSAPKGMLIKPYQGSNSNCPSGTTPYTLDSIGSKTSGDVCISSYSEVPDRAFVATKRLKDDNGYCGVGAFYYRLEKVTNNQQSGVCSIAKTYGQPIEFVIKGLTSAPSLDDNCFGFDKYNIALETGSTITEVCPQTLGVPTGYFLAPSSTPLGSNVCNLIYRRLSGNSVDVCLNSNQTANDFAGWYPSAEVGGYCPAGMRAFKLKLLSGNADEVIWFNTAWWRPKNYAIVPRDAGSCSAGSGLRCSRIMPAANEMTYCYGAGVTPDGYSKGVAVNVAPLVCPGSLSAFTLLMDPPPTPVSNPATFVNPEPPITTKPAVPVLDFTCPGDKC